MANSYNIGEHAYIVESGYQVREVVVTKYSGGFYQVRFLDSQGAINIKESRLYKTREDAEKSNSSIREEMKEKGRANSSTKRTGFRSPYDYE
ncbi:MAG: hypothetical protein K6G88_11850 [Lachnospiraceae bacterium]|nr:hypothetical protein [Lachnospiraceae bacterium]